MVAKKLRFYLANLRLSIGDAQITFLDEASGE
jgi:hypothetical protein